MKFLNLLKTPWPYAALLVAHIIWGANTVVVKVTLNEFPVMSLNFIRFGLATLLILPFLLNVDRKSLRVRFEDWPKIILASLLMVTATIALSYEGIKHTTAINASVLGLIVPILSVLGGWFFLKEHVYWANIFGIISGLAGCLIIVGIPLLFFGTFSGSNLFGDGLVLLAGVCFTAGTIVAKKILDKYSALLITAISFFVAFLSFSVPAGLEYSKNPEWINSVTLLGVLGLLYITILASVCAFFLMEWGLKKTDVIKANLFQYVEPAVAATIALPVLGERISFSFIIGTVLIVLGVYWGTLGKSYHHRLLHRHHRA